MDRTKLIERLRTSDNPSICWKVRVGVLDEAPDSRSLRQLREQIRAGPIVRALLARRDADGRVRTRGGPYDKWQGAHWVFAALADVGYPSGDDALVPLRDQVVSFWLRDEFFEEFDAQSRAQAYRRIGVPIMQGRHRRCASQQGNALRAAATLGLLDSTSSRLVERLLHWQWPDGGWNCDKNPSADTSSFMETLLPMRGLAAYARSTHDADASAAAHRAAAVFLSRRLFRRRSDGSVIHPDFVKLHHPVYWHYDVLAGLLAMTELGLIGAPQCSDALDVLERAELPDGGWAANARFFVPGHTVRRGADDVDWGGTSRRAPNDWISAAALTVLHAAGRI